MVITSGPVLPGIPEAKISRITFSTIALDSSRC